MQLHDIRLMNDTMILYLKKMGKSSKRNEIINNILNDDSCFFKMNKEDAHIILEDIGIEKDKINLIYSNLISSDNYYKLQKEGKINENDEDIILKYKSYKYDELFKQSKSSIKEKHIVENVTAIAEYKEPILKKIINKIRNIFSKN